MNSVIYNYGKAVTKSDTVNIVQPAGKKFTDALFIGTAGTVTVVFEDDSTLAFEVVAGTLLTVAVKRVNSTGTDMTDILALWII